MSLSSRDVEEIENEPLKEPRFTGFFVGVIRLLAKIPYVKKKLNNSSGGLAGSIFSSWESKDYKRATEISIYALERFRHKKDRLVPHMAHHNWWSFMKHGVDSAKHIEDKDLKDKLVTLASNGIEPFEGYDVAYSYLEFSRWEYQENKYEEAVKYAEVASNADSTWAEPEFILGWYGLLLSKGNAEEHLNKAIERDHRVLFRIVNNEICKQYPHILNKLKAKYSTTDVVNNPNQANPADAKKRRG